MTELVEEAREQLQAHVGIKKSCELAGISRATLYRRRNPRPKSEDRVPRPSPPNRLSPAECEQIIAMLNNEEFRDKSPRQVWAALLDRGVYLASVSTMYRLLRTAGQVRERRA